MLLHAVWFVEERPKKINLCKKCRQVMSDYQRDRRHNKPGERAKINARQRAYYWKAKRLKP